MALLKKDRRFRIKKRVRKIPEKITTQLSEDTKDEKEK